MASDLDVWTPGRLDVWMSGYLVVWLSGCLVVWMSGCLDVYTDMVSRVGCGTQSTYTLVHHYADVGRRR